jgi:hypothetical protein
LEGYCNHLDGHLKFVARRGRHSGRNKACSRARRDLVERGMQSAPVCPGCGYDLTGLVASWPDAWPLDARCAECGTAWPSGSIFALERGPWWSAERRGPGAVRRWAAETVVALLPRRLWRGLALDQPVRVRRLAAMGLGWLALLHLTAAALVIGFEVLLPGPATPMFQWSYRWTAGTGVGIAVRLLWPYQYWIEIPTGPNQSIGEPIDEMVIVALVPHLAMAGLVALWAGPLRRGEVPRRHAFRALVLCLPNASLWLVLWTAAFGAMAAAEGVWPDNPVSGWLMIGMLAAYFASIVWWWRCFALEYLGNRRGVWMLILLGLVAIALTWCAEFAKEALVRWLISL